MRAPQTTPPRLTSAPYLLVAPLALVLVVFFGIPLLLVVIVSFFDLDKFDIIPTFVLTNYSELFGSSLTYALYAKTIKYALIVWAITLVIGFTVSYFLVFHVRNVLWQIALFLLCTVPFWTSNVIRMISWIPFLGRNGLFNQSLMALGLTQRPVEFLLFSDFSVVIAYVHLFSLFMIVPIFNSMARIDRAVIEAVADGHRLVERPPVDLLCFGGVLYALCAVPLRPHVRDLHPVLPGTERWTDLPDERRVIPLVRGPRRPAAVRRFCRVVRPVNHARRPRPRDHRGDFDHGRAGLSLPVSGSHGRFLYG